MQLGANNRNLELKIKCWVSEICKLHAVKEKNGSCFRGCEHTNIPVVQIVDGGLHIKKLTHCLFKFNYNNLQCRRFAATRTTRKYKFVDWHRITEFKKNTVCYIVCYI
jgi:hypothetical protein